MVLRVHELAVRLHPSTRFHGDCAELVDRAMRLALIDPPVRGWPHGPPHWTEKEWDAIVLEVRAKAAFLAEELDVAGRTGRPHGG